MQETALTRHHEALGAKMTDFAGYNMPLMYSGVREEHLAVRSGCGIFDVSHMGEFIIRGKEALDLIQLVTTNDASKLQIGDAQYSCLPNEKGGIVDDLLVYRLEEDHCSEGEHAFMLVVNAANIQKDLDWIQQHNQFDTRIIDISSQTGLLAIQGPETATLLQEFTPVDLSSIPFYKFKRGAFAGQDNVIISATGYTGSGGFELYAKNDAIVKIWETLFASGVAAKITPCGLGARDTLRLEMGYCLYGNDIDDTTSPIEAGLGWITKLKKGEFISRPIFAKQKEDGVVKKLVAFTINDRRMPRKGYVIEDSDGQEIGVVTSGTFSPSLEMPIGMGYVKTAFSKPETALRVVAGRKRLEGTVTKLPFLKI